MTTLDEQSISGSDEWELSGERVRVRVVLSGKWMEVER